jgi:threonine aldolase
MIDFRSDTVTKPSKEMREAMASAEVGDDVFGDDPTINELERYAAEMFGFESALFCTSGTQSNQIAINVWTNPGDEVICHEESHIYRYEGGGIALNSFCSMRFLRGNSGRINPEEIYNQINPDDQHYPVTSSS